MIFSSLLHNKIYLHANNTLNFNVASNIECKVMYYMTFYNPKGHLLHAKRACFAMQLTAFCYVG